MLIDFFKKPAPKRHISPKIRAFGKARIDIARRANNVAEWDQLWKKPTNPFPFEWGEHWKQCVEYKVDDFAAEVGFYIDILGLPVNAFDPDYAMFTSPDGDFYLAVIPKVEGGKSTPPEALRIQFMVADLLETTKELERRGILFIQKPQPCTPGSSMCIACFHTPHGISIDLWGIADPSLLETEVEEVRNNNDAFGAELAESSHNVDSEFDDFGMPVGVEEVFPFLVEPEIFVDASMGRDEEQYLAMKSKPGGFRSIYSHEASQPEMEQFKEPEEELEDSSEGSIGESQMRFFDEESIENSEPEADKLSEEYDPDSGENDHTEESEDTDEESDEDGTLYEYTYEDDF